VKGSIGDIMKQAQEMQETLQRAQQDIANMEISGESGAGMVRVVMTGRHDIKRVQIDPALMNEDREMLEDLIAAAVNDANRRLEQATRDKMAGFASSLNLPAGFKLPF
jgi:nucleoid-associated protein EbfC